jgi:hypothetical protein
MHTRRSANRALLPLRSSRLSYRTKHQRRPSRPRRLQQPGHVPAGSMCDACAHTLIYIDGTMPAGAAHHGTAAGQGCSLHRGVAGRGPRPLSHSTSPSARPASGTSMGSKPPLHHVCTVPVRDSTVPVLAGTVVCRYFTVLWWWRSHKHGRRQLPCHRPPASNKIRMPLLR